MKSYALLNKLISNQLLLSRLQLKPLKIIFKVKLEKKQGLHEKALAYMMLNVNNTALI